jgi:hypothetical protein
MSGFRPLGFYQWPILLSIAHYRKLTFHCGKQGKHVRVFIMHLGSIEFLYLSVQPLHKIRLQSRNLEKVMQSVLA